MKNLRRRPVSASLSEETSEAWRHVKAGKELDEVNYSRNIVNKLTMKQLNLNIPLMLKTEEELTPQEADLLEQAKQASLRSYSPYSHFSVGAAALLDDDTVITGSNQENSAYPSGLCAERTAVFYANSRYPERTVRLLCVVARNTDGRYTERPIPPCGACRQVLSETEDRQRQPMRIMLYGTSGIVFLNTVKDLLPLHFDTTFL